MEVEAVVVVVKRVAVIGLEAFGGVALRTVWVHGVPPKNPLLPSPASQTYLPLWV